MGKTKTTVIEGDVETKLSGAEKYKLKQQKKAVEDAKSKQVVKGVGLKGGERVKVIGSDLPEETPEETFKRKRGPKVRGKKYVSAKVKIDKSKLYSAPEAIKLVVGMSSTKFDSSIELHLVMKKDVNVTLELPHSTGSSKRIEIANESTIKKLESGKVDYDVLLATPEYMAKLVPFAKILGPKGLMPNPKTSTLIKTEAEAKKFSANTMTVKTERKAPLVHMVVGKVSMKESELENNLAALVKAVNPKLILKAYLTASMTPSVRLSI